ncbi:MAG: ferrous iron transport protein A [Clostridiales bacterium]|nr:MAG: ferrous iron transport protein A [Clostridiales bacterium]
MKENSYSHNSEVAYAVGSSTRRQGRESRENPCGREKRKKHLENLGITIDSVIRVISASGGSVICVVKDGRLALDKEMATKILIA